MAHTIFFRCNLLLIIFFGLIGTMHAQQTIQVFDALSQRGLAAATVQLVNTNTQFITNENGVVYVPNGVNRWNITHTGYEPQTIANMNNNFLVYMMPATIKLKPFNLVGRAQYNSAIAHQNITKKALEANNYGQDLPYLLQNTVGAVATSDAGTGIGYTGLRIRGTDASRINVTINGIALNDAESQNVYWVDVPDIASSTQSVQIQRGVGVSSSGSGAFGASINVLTNAQKTEPFVEYSGTVGAFRTFKNTLSFGTGSINGKWIFDARISKINSGGYIQRANANLLSGGANLGYYRKKNTFKACILLGKERTYQAWYGVPQDSLITNRTYNPAGYYTKLGNNQGAFYDDQTDNYTQNHYQFFYIHDFNNYWQFNSAAYMTQGSGYYREYQDNKTWANFNLQNPLLKDTAGNVIENLDLITQRWLSNNLYGVNAHLSFNGRRITADFGTNYSDYRGSHFGVVEWAQYNPIVIDSSMLHRSVVSNRPVYYLNDARKRDASAFIKGSYRFWDNKMNVFGDVQVRYVDYIFAPKPHETLLPPQQSAGFLFINPKMGATFKVNNTQNIYAYFGIANREPARDDMVNAPQNQRPAPEKLYNTELGYRYNKGNFNAEVGAYLMNYTNQMVLTGAINDVGEFTRINVDKSYRRGIEVNVNYTAQSKKVAFEGNVALSENKILNFDEYAPDYINGGNILIKNHVNTHISFAPPVVAGGTLSLRPINWLPLINVSTKYVGRQFLDNTSNDLRSIEAFWVHNIKISQTYKPNKDIKEFGWAIMINNAMNALYVNNGYTYSYYLNRPSDPTLYTSNNYFPQATRHIMAMFFVKI